jgi:hypothetical protein
MRLDQKQFSSPVFGLRMFAQICKQTHHYRWKGFWVIFHLQGDNGAEVYRRIIDDVSEIAIECNEHGIEALRAINNVRVFAFIGR